MNKKLSSLGANMKTKQDHMPTPFMLANNKQWIVDQGGMTIAKMEAYDGFEKDAAYIVLAVNAHEGLVYACKLALADHSRWETPEDHVVQDVLKVAIAKAEGK